jgi:tetratricopeptide (TPR) repeat protein
VILLVTALLPTAAQDQNGDAALPTPVATPRPAVVISPELFDRAGQSYDAQNYKQALMDYSLFILLNPTFSPAYYGRALSYIQLQDNDHALADLSQALQYPARDATFTAQVYIRRARIYLSRNDVDAALADLNAGIKAAPEVPDTYLLRARLYSAQDKVDSALADYNRILALDPDFADAYADRGILLLQTGKLDDALKDYNRLIELAPNYAPGYAQRAQVHSQQKKYDAALLDLNNALRLGANDPNINVSTLYLSRGYVQTQLKNPAEAAGDYTEWVKRIRTDVLTRDALRPGESVVVPMRAGAVYLFPLRAKAGQRLTFSATVPAGENTDPLLIVYDPQGSPVTADDDSGGEFNALVTDYVVPTDGLYAVVLTHAGGGRSGPVRVLMQVGEAK